MKSSVKQKLNVIFASQQNWEDDISNFILSIVPVEKLASMGTCTFADTVMNKLGPMYVQNGSIQVYKSKTWGLFGSLVTGSNCKMIYSQPRLANDN